jgi:hypothetical protein
MCHQVEHHEISPAASVGSINRTQQLLNEVPVKRPRRPFITKSDWQLKKVKLGFDQIAVVAVAEKGSQTAYAGSQGATGQSASPLL